MLLNCPGALSCGGAMYFAATAADSIPSWVSWVIRLRFVYREQEYITGASHTPGTQWQGRARDIFFIGLWPWYAELDINTVVVFGFVFFFFAKRHGEKSWLLEQIFERARTVLTNYRYEPLTSLSSLIV